MDGQTPHHLLLTDRDRPSLGTTLAERGPLQVAREPTPFPPTTRVVVAYDDDRDASRVLRALRADPGTALAPILILESPDGVRATEDARFADAVWPEGRPGLPALLERLDAVGRAVGELPLPTVDLVARELRIVTLLRGMVTRKIETLNPARHSSSTKGYNFPVAGVVLGLPRGEEIEVLEDLADLGLFRREFQDRIHLCPYCGHYAINFREVCPTCRSSHLSVVENVHHYRCGHVAPETDFRQGEDLVCPKCRRVLRHVGVDFDRPNQVVLCQSCRAAATEPEVECLSLACGKVFPPEAARRLDIQTYRLTGQGIAAAEKGVLPARTLPELLHETFRTAPPSTFEELVHVARVLAERYGRPFCLGRFTIANHERLLEIHGAAEVVATLKALVEVLRGILRETDVLCPEGEDGFRALFLETDRPGYDRAVQRALAEVGQRIRPTVDLEAAWVEGGP